LKSWQFDRGSEFLNELFDEWIVRTLGAKQLFSNVEHPWENGRAERSFGTIFSKARAMLKYADLPNGLWGKAVQHAVYLKNRCPSTRLNFIAPLQFRTGEQINYKNLRVFGCPAQIFVRVKERANSKLSSRSEKGTFIGNVEMDLSSACKEQNESLKWIPKTSSLMRPSRIVGIRKAKLSKEGGY
jgi:hypothetical protein